ncbi:MAG TPA: carbohydrate ABC transporter permease [bacterium]|mgnify:CR=1 FL=1|nr:carbohydrate ABC transporter permease [bacterium]
MREKQFKKAMLGAGYVSAVIFCLLPFVYMLYISFIDAASLFSKQEAAFTLKNYVNVIKGENLHFLTYLKNSVVIALISSLVTVIIAGLGAYAVTRMDFKWKTAVLLGVLGVSFFPQISIAGYIFKMLAALGLLNTYTGLIFPYTAWALPLSLWILAGYFLSVPPDLDKAAKVDGAGNFQIMAYVILPVALPGIVTAFLLSFIFMFNEFLFALMFTSDEAARTVPVAIALFTGLHGQVPWGDIMAAAALTTAPIAALAAVFQKRIISGLTQGAVK